jgi:DNA anti-recombination protein RmuC
MTRAINVINTPYNRASKINAKLKWIKKTNELTSKTGLELSRGIQQTIRELKDDNSVMLVKVRKRDAAVVMSVDNYNELVSLRSEISQLVKHVKRTDIECGHDEYESLYRRISSPDSTQSVDTLFIMSDADIGANHKAGATERP